MVLWLRVAKGPRKDRARWVVSREKKNDAADSAGPWQRGGVQGSRTAVEGMCAGRGGVALDVGTRTSGKAECENGFAVKPTAVSARFETWNLQLPTCDFEHLSSKRSRRLIYQRRRHRTGRWATEIRESPLQPFLASNLRAATFRTAFFPFEVFALRFATSISQALRNGARQQHLDVNVISRSACGGKA